MNLFKEVNIVYYKDLIFEFEYFLFFLKKPTVSMPCLVMELSHHLSLSSQNKVYHDVFDTRCEMHPAMIMDKEGAAGSEFCFYYQKCHTQIIWQMTEEGSLCDLIFASLSSSFHTIKELGIVRARGKNLGLCRTQFWLVWKGLKIVFFQKALGPAWILVIGFECFLKGM